MATRCTGWLVGLMFMLAAATADAGEKAGKAIHPRPLDEVRKTLSAILVPGDKKPDEKAQALQRLKAYRYLAEPYDDLTLDEEYNKMCLAGAKLCEKLGKIDHKPMNPGLPEAEFKLATQSTSRSNLGQGLQSLVLSVDAWTTPAPATSIGSAIAAGA